MTTRTILCACGGRITISSEPLYGRTVELCHGPCHYEGAPRSPAPIVEPERPLRGQPCERCGTITRTPRAVRCDVCQRWHHRHQAAEIERQRRIRVREERAS